MANNLLSVVQLRKDIVARMNELGITTLQDLAAADVPLLAAQLDVDMDIVASWAGVAAETVVWGEQVAADFAAGQETAVFEHLIGGRVRQ